jgi:hypothetical protein
LQRTPPRCGGSLATLGDAELYALGVHVKVGSVPVRNFVGLFMAVYLVLMLAFGGTFLLLGKPPASSVNTITILLAVTAVGYLFARKYRRTFTATEYRNLLVGSVAADAAIQVVMAAPLVSAEVFSQSFLVGLLVVLAGHSLLLALGYSTYVVRRYVPAVSPQQGAPADVARPAGERRG